MTLIALTRLQPAKHLLERCADDKPDAIDHVNFAIGEFREMKIQPSLEKALKLCLVH